MKKGRKIELPELKKIELGILEQVHRICEEQGIRYAMCGGTLLGAVRHKGFIPWDDDIDILMPRDDYKRFVNYCMSNEMPFRLVCSQTEPKYGYLFAKVINPQTVLIENHGNRGGVELGVCIDIFPIDALGVSKEEGISVLNKTRFMREVLVAANWKHFFRSRTRAWYYEPIRFCFFLISRFFRLNNLIKRIEDRYPDLKMEDTAYSGCVCGAYRNKEVLETEIFLEYVDMEFEGKVFKGLKHYDQYMKSIYGDYMKLPPVEKRVAHHTFSAFWKE